MSVTSDLKTPEGQHATVIACVEECFNYAAWQNAMPLVKSVVVDNSLDCELTSAMVEMSATPAFVRPKCWKLDRIESGQQVNLRDVDVEVDVEYLDRLDEAVRGVLSFRLLRNGVTIAELNATVRVLARDEWGGMGSMGELLAAFVTPNDPALAPLLKSTSDALGHHGHGTALDGYQSKDPNRSFILAAALWAAVAARSLTYANPPRSFEQVGQKTRRVAAVLADGLATCLDTSLLFSSGLEAVGLNPLIVMTKGHCFAGVWLIERTFKKLIEPDISELRKAIVAKELIVFETTLVTRRPAATLEEAMEVAGSALAESLENEFICTLDIARARMSQVLPLPSHGERAAASGDFDSSSSPSLPGLPGYEPPVDDLDESKPQNPDGRVDRWQRKLLDLSLRNRLLNFSLTKQTVPIVCPDISGLEDRLAHGKKLRLVSLINENTVGERDASLHQQRTHKDLDLEFSGAALERDEVACLVDEHELNSRLTALFRKVKNDLAEGGSNTLYLAVGFLRWKQNPSDAKTYRAPLLLVPVTLQRRSASSPFYLSHHEDEVRFNSTLLQLLKKDFGCDLTRLDSELPNDKSGVDVPKVLERMRRAVRDIRGFEVVEEVAIGSFSFAKYLMWKDLVERIDQLERNRVVRHLISEPDKPYTSIGSRPMPQPHEIDARYQPLDLVHPLSADSSQLSAVMAASEGHDFVIVGPPGTGKSQTIANVIAQCLSVGKTVLFVAEKTAALDVVHRRLKEHGLGECCIELHSNKAERRRLLDQLEASWNRRNRPSHPEWIEVSTRLRVRRDELNSYVAAIHAQHRNGWTVYRAMGLCIMECETAAPVLTLSQSEVHDQVAFESLKTAVNQLALAASVLPRTADIGRVGAPEWSLAWESEFVAACGRLKMAAQNLLSCIARLASAFRLLLRDDITSSQLSALYRLAQELTRNELPPTHFILHPQLDVLKAELIVRRELSERRDHANDRLASALRSFAATLGHPPSEGVSNRNRDNFYRLANELVKPALPPISLIFNREFDKLSERLNRHVELTGQRMESLEAVEARGFNSKLFKQLKLSTLETEWKKALASFWPLSRVRQNAVKKKLQSFMKPDHVADPEIDLAFLRDYQNCLDSLAENMAEMELSKEMQATVEKDPHNLIPLIETAHKFRGLISATGILPENVAAATQQSLEPLIAAAKCLYSPGHEVEQMKSALHENLEKLDLPQELKMKVAETPDALRQLIEAASRLRQSSQSLDIPIDMIAILVDVHGESGRQTASECCQAAKSFRSAWDEYTKLADVTPAPIESSTIVGDAFIQAEKVLAHRTLLKQWTAWVTAKQRAEELGLKNFANAIELGELLPSEISDRFDLAYARWWLPPIFDRSDTLRKFQRVRHEEAIEEFKRLDELSRETASSHVLQSIDHGLQSADQVPRKSELGMLRHQMGLKRPSKSIREIISGMPSSFGKLAPCLLMSPLSIAQYLPANQAQFDVVVFDEASQIATWDAIGAIARGKQTIIVGDPKQLPPTNFFGRADNDENNELIDYYEKDLESILDEAQASGLPTLQLNWHYRSRHEALIAFSNYHYYGNQLVTFPAAESHDRGVSLTVVDGAIYDRGKSRTNRGEAEAIVADAVARMQRCLAKPEGERLTYGVVTFNGQQQSLIQDLFDQALRDAPELEWFFADERIEPTAVKNLENVQGDERDIIYFSITFGKDSQGRFPIDFGAINRTGGERRLNVAVTRARQALLVYSSFQPDQLRAERSTARGVNDLKAFLVYADKGPNAIAPRTDESVGDSDSPFEKAVADAITKRGWQLDPRVGISGFRVDFGVIHPDRPGVYLAGIECDGATYHRAAAARDRDKTRQHVLQGLGWRILRVWSTDWFYDPRAGEATLHDQLTSLLETSRNKSLAAFSNSVSDQTVTKGDGAPTHLSNNAPEPGKN